MEGWARNQVCLSSTRCQKPTRKARRGCWACSLCAGNLKGSSRSANPVRLGSSVLFQRLGPTLGLILLLPYILQRMMGFIPPQSFCRTTDSGATGGLPFGCKALTASRQGAPTPRRRRRAELSGLREGTWGPRSLCSVRAPVET